MLRCFPGSPATAFLHSVMRQKNRGMMKVWNVWLFFLHVFLAAFSDVSHTQRQSSVFSVHMRLRTLNRPLGRGFSLALTPLSAVCFIAYINKNRD